MSQFFFRCALVVVAISAVGLVALVAPASVVETLVGTGMIIAIAYVAIREQRRVTAETQAILDEAEVFHRRAQALLGNTRKRIV